jgi:hypothetical protein
VKAVTVLTVILTMAFSACVGAATLEEMNSHLFTNAVIAWQAPTNHLPERFWVYQRLLPCVFSETVISNGIVLGSLQAKGFPQSSTNDFFISEDKGPDYPGPIPTIFGIKPGDAYMYYSMPNYSTGSGKEIPDDETIVKRAWKDASQLGLDPTKLAQQSMYTHSCETDQNIEGANVCGRGVFLSRQLDGVAFFSAADDGESAEGFSIEFGEYGKIRAFSVRWSNVERYESHRTASTQEIIRCIKAHKTIVLPNVDERNYFSRLEHLASTKRLIVTKITPYYGEGIFGKVPTNDAPSMFATPFAELEAVADFGNSNATIRFVAPILSSEVNRLLGK